MRSRNNDVESSGGGLGEPCQLCGPACACSGPHDSIEAALIAAARAASPPTKLTPALGRTSSEDETVVVEVAL